MMASVIRVRSLDHLVLRVRDVDSSLRFYRDVLGCGVEGEPEFRRGDRPFLSLRAGDQLLDLVPDAAYDHGRSDGGLLHFCVTVEGDFTGAVQSLRDAGVPLIHDQPVVRGGARGNGLSIYVTDPDGYIVEVKEH